LELKLLLTDGRAYLVRCLDPMFVPFQDNQPCDIVFSMIIIKMQAHALLY